MTSEKYLTTGYLFFSFLATGLGPFRQKLFRLKFNMKMIMSTICLQKRSWKPKINKYSECLKSELIWISDSSVAFRFQTVWISDTFLSEIQTLENINGT